MKTTFKSTISHCVPCWKSQVALQKAQRYINATKRKACITVKKSRHHISIKFKKFTEVLTLRQIISQYIVNLGKRWRNFSRGWTGTLTADWALKNSWARRPPWRNSSKTWTKTMMELSLSRYRTQSIFIKRVICFLMNSSGNTKIPKKYWNLLIERFLVQ